MRRRGRRARVVAGHTGKKCNSLDITRLMNLTDEARASILTAPLAELTRARKMSDEEAEAEAAAEAKAKEDAEKANDDAEKAKEDAENANKDADEASQHRRERPEGWRPKRLAAASAADARRPDAFLGGVHVADHGGARVGTRVGVTRSVAPPRALGALRGVVVRRATPWPRRWITFERRTRR